MYYLFKFIEFFSAVNFRQLLGCQMGDKCTGYFHLRQIVRIVFDHWLRCLFISKW